MKYISLVFEEDIDTKQLDDFEELPGCTGVSAYKNTLNIYFRTLTRNTLFNLALVLHKHLERGEGVLLANSTLDSTASATSIYDALREEVAI